jgi:predicted transcriptional regulator
MPKEPPRPTPAELEILGVLWELGPSTVREVQEELDSRRSTGYTTVLKLLQIMTEKKLVRRDASAPSSRWSVISSIAPSAGRRRAWS